MHRRKLLMGIAGVAGVLATILILEIDAANNLEIDMKEYKVLSRDDNNGSYLVSLQMTNNRLFMLSAGEIEYTIGVNGELLGSGTIRPFYLGPYSSMIIDSEFTVDNHVAEKYNDTIHDQNVEVGASSKYNLYMLSFEVPFNHSPTKHQIEHFLRT